MKAYCNKCECKVTPVEVNMTPGSYLGYDIICPQCSQSSTLELIRQERVTDKPSYKQIIRRPRRDA